jgi:hypothetical protein
MLSTPHSVRFCPPERRQKLVSSDSRHLASLKKGGPERGRFFFSRSGTLAVRDEIRKRPVPLRILLILIAFLSRPHSVKPRTSRDFLEILNRRRLTSAIVPLQLTPAVYRAYDICSTSRGIEFCGVRLFLGGLHQMAAIVR